MLRFALFSVLMLAIYAKAEGRVLTYCYEDSLCGPDSVLWGGQCKTGTRQSPIDLPEITGATAAAVPLDFNGYDFNNFQITNNGHTITVPSSTMSSAKLTGYGLEWPYILAEVHFHWGKDDNSGSEHTLNGAHYAMEVHFVHYYSKYPSFAVAAQSGDAKAIAVVGAFLQPGSENDVHPAFDKIVANMPLQYNGNAQVNEELDFGSMLPKSGQEFYRYIGSLTTPQCNEVVVWTVIKKPVMVKPSTIQKSRMVQKDNSMNLIGTNIRPLQMLNGRVVEYLWKS